MYISSEFENEDPDNTDGDLQTETTDEPTKKKRAKRSAIHTHFDIEDEKWMCKSCGSKFTVNLQTTSTPLRHLRDKHPNLCTSNEDLSSLVVLAEDFSTEIFQNKLVDTVISECLPFSIVESPWLKDIFNYCHPAAILPQRRKLKSEIFKKYENEKSNLMETLTNIPGKISCILDNWTSSNMHPYQGIIVQYVSENWEIVSIVLDLTLLEGSHSGVNMANALITVLEEYNILDKLIAITTDNATNNNTMVRELSTKMNEKGFHFDCENNRVRCFAHIVNLACTAAFEEIKCVTSLQAEDSENVEISLISKLRNGVKAIRVSTLKREAFRDQCKSQKTKHNELIIDVKTRWNSTYYMIKRSLKLKVPFTTTLKADTECSKYALTDEEFEILEKVRLLLKPFKTATKDISNTPFPTISLCSLLYNQIFKHLELYFPNISNEYNPIDELTNEAPPEWLQKAAKTAWDKMDTYYPTSDGLVYIIGSIMDPRCKLTWFNDNFPADDVNNYKKTIVSYWTSHYKPTVEDVNTQFSPERSKNAWVRHVYSKEKTKKKSDELEIYLREKTSLNPDKSALDWWKLHEDEYPNLSKMARDFLHISGSGVPVECLFSNGPDLLRNRRQSLNDESITKCICLKLWLAKGGENTAGKAAAEKMGGI